LNEARAYKSGPRYQAYQSERIPIDPGSASRPGPASRIACGLPCTALSPWSNCRSLRISSPGGAATQCLSPPARFASTSV